MHSQQLKHAVIKAGCGWSPGEKLQYQAPASRWQSSAASTVYPRLVIQACPKGWSDLRLHTAGITD